jgi:hypothetical protein
VAGRVEAIRIAASAGAPMETVWRVAAHAGGGLDGDRYHLGTGDGSAGGGDGRGLTLVSADSIEKANKENPGLDMTPALTRRNVTVRGVDLDGAPGPSPARISRDSSGARSWPRSRTGPVCEPTSSRTARSPWETRSTSPEAPRTPRSTQPAGVVRGSTKSPRDTHRGPVSATGGRFRGLVGSDSA